MIKFLQLIATMILWWVALAALALTIPGAVLQWLAWSALFAINGDADRIRELKPNIALDLPPLNAAEARQGI